MVTLERRVEHDGFPPGEEGVGPLSSKLWAEAVSVASCWQWVAVLEGKGVN